MGPTDNFSIVLDVVHLMFELWINYVEATYCKNIRPFTFILSFVLRNL